MTGPMRAVLALLLAVPLSVATPALVLACDCDLPRDEAEALAVADLAFVGRVVGLDGDLAVFEVERALKGDPGSRIAVDQMARTDCSAGLVPGDRWTVFVVAGPAGPVTGQCAGNLPMATTAAEPPGGPGAGVPPGVVVAGLIVLVVAAASIVAFRRPAGDA